MPTVHMSQADVTQVILALREFEANLWEVPDAPDAGRDLAHEFCHGVLTSNGDGVKLEVTAKDAGIVMSALAAEVLRKQRAGQDIHGTARIMREFGAKVNGK